jgi:hypothetical protein
MGLAFALAACLAVEAAEPVPSAPPAKPAAAAPVAPATKPPQVKKPLDLRIGDVRKYMMPDEYSDALNAPDADKNTVVVEGRRELLPMKSEQPVPGGIMAPFWMLAHPLNAWRTLVPDYQHQPKDEEREPADKVPPPIFRWGP